MQKHRVVAWLSQHNFPHGVVSFCDGLTHDPLRQKAMFLQSLVQEVRRLGRVPPPSCWLGRAKLIRSDAGGSPGPAPKCTAPPLGLTGVSRQVELNIVAGYGSPKDVAVYAALGLPPSQTYIVGRAVRKLQAQCQVRDR